MHGFIFIEFKITAIMRFLVKKRKYGINEGQLGFYEPVQSCNMLMLYSLNNWCPGYFSEEVATLHDVNHS